MAPKLQLAQPLKYSWHGRYAAPPVAAPPVAPPAAAPSAPAAPTAPTAPPVVAGPGTPGATASPASPAASASCYAAPVSHTTYRYGRMVADTVIMGVVGDFGILEFWNFGIFVINPLALPLNSGDCVAYEAHFCLLYKFVRDDSCKGPS
jgi:hypothetical protein